MIIGVNIDSSRIDHQKHNSIKHLTKKTEKNKNSNLSEEAIKLVSRYESKKVFSRNTS